MIVKGIKRETRQSIFVGLALISPVVILQSLLAPYYVPFLLGDGWAEVAPLVSILCLVAIPTTLWSIAAGWLRVHGKPQVELWMTATVAAAVLASTAMLAPYGLLTMAIGYLVTTSTLMLLGAYQTLHPALSPSCQRVPS